MLRLDLVPSPRSVTRASTPPALAHARRHRRDRHGRGLPGPLLPPTLPGWRTRAEQFDELVAREAQMLSARHEPVEQVQFAVEDVPPSDPSPWEHGVVLARAFSAEPRAGLPARVVVYRRPVCARASGLCELTELVHLVVVEQVAQMLGLHPEDLDPDL